MYLEEMKISYLCNPELNTECSKTRCGMCRHTSKIEYSKNYEVTPYKEVIEKHFFAMTEHILCEADAEFIIGQIRNCCDCNVSEFRIEQICKFIRLNLKSKE